MKIKTKLLTMVSLMALTVVMLVVGVWALKTVNFTIDGSLSYIAPGIEATISKGTVTNGVWVNASDASVKMPETQITRTDTEDTLTAKFSYWQDINLNFNDSGDDIQITFSITNDSSSKYILIDVSTSYESADNATISVDTTSTMLDPKGSHTFTLTMAVTDKTVNATMTNFAVVFNMELATLTPLEDVPNLTFSYNADTMEATIVDCDTSVTSIEIPQLITYNNHVFKISCIGNNVFSGCTSLTNITIPSSITSIGTRVFDSCSSLQSIIVEEGNRFYDSRNECNAIIETSSNTLIFGCKNTQIPNDVTSIRDYAFYKHTGITSVDIPASVTSIGGYAYSNCTGLTKVSLTENLIKVSSTAFYTCENLEYASYGNGLYLGNSENPYTLLMEKGETTSTVTIHEDCKVIAASAFNSASFSNLVLPTGLISIGGGAFSSCDSLTTTTIPSSVTYIGSNPFASCDSLTSIAVDSGNSVYNSNNDCNAIIETETNTLISGCTNTTIPSTVEVIGTNAFCGANFTSITIPNSVTTIEYASFQSCKSLTGISIPSSVKSIGSHAFNACTGLTTITIPDSVTSIGSSAFYNCTGLTSVDLGNSLTRLETNVFYKCTSLKSVSVPDNLTYMASSIFGDCTLNVSLYGNGKYLGNDTNPYVICLGNDDTTITSCNINENCKIIASSAFQACTSLTSISIPAGVRYIGTSAFTYCPEIADITVDAGNAFYNSNNDCNAIIETATGTLIAGCKNTIIPNTVQIIGSNAFYQCTGLTEIDIPDSVKRIEGSAFAYCTGLTMVTIGRGVSYIGSAFVQCKNLATLKIEATIVPQLATYPFLMGKTPAISVPSGSLYAYQRAYGWTGYASILVGV